MNPKQLELLNLARNKYGNGGFAEDFDEGFKAGFEAALAEKDEEIENLKKEHADFCNYAQEKTDVDFKGVRDFAEQQRELLSRYKKALSMAQVYFDKDPQFDKIIVRINKALEGVDDL